MVRICTQQANRHPHTQATKLTHLLHPGLTFFWCYITPQLPFGQCERLFLVQASSIGDVKLIEIRDINSKLQKHNHSVRSIKPTCPKSSQSRYMCHRLEIVTVVRQRGGSRYMVQRDLFWLLHFVSLAECDVLRPTATPATPKHCVFVV